MTKSFKTLVLLASISLFTSVTYSSAEARDCSNPKGFHEKMMCQLSGDSKAEVDTTNDGSESSGFMKKLKKFLGKKNNQG